MKKTLEERLRRHVPPGIDVRRELRWIFWGGALSAVYSLGFFIKYWEAHDGLFFWQNGSKTLDPAAVMPDFREVLGGSLAGFLVLALCMAALAAYHYAYHYEGGRSIYLMRRLPSRAELPRRCLTLPGLVAAACLAAALVLLLIYFAAYMALTPRECLTPRQWRKLWSFLWGGSL